MKSNYKILSIESSCDETSCAVVQDGRLVLSNVVSSQIDIHTRFGGVVPEVASRNHISAIDNVVNSALTQANLTLNEIDAIAVTYGAGLLGALLVGVSYAKALAYASKKPLIAVNHIYGHIASNYISYKELQPPFLCLLVSGGHTALIKVDNYISHTVVGETMDDSVGESFDKIARVLGLGYPGGPMIQKYANGGKDNIVFAKQNDNMGYNFSFSGKKTAVINYVHKLEQNNIPIPVPNICASYQKWAVDELVDKTIKASVELNMDKIVIAGGVSANVYLRDSMKQKASAYKKEVYFPEMKYCTDNAAMIGSAAYYLIQNGVPFADNTLAPNPSIPL
ncbi:MAG: tRNA (adenosine(37)-N6)-threonylcarbamoyltransferase complex transferase subunit TsaD [Clostridia bacterium]|nr:tRNA (adenosine(37)-N6)-threonylcarbamoyltransferase complex transferase subunit TsaD [Clostridia bacterium]